MSETSLNPEGFATLAVSTVAVAPTMPTVFMTNEQRTVNKTVQHMLVRIVGQPIRWRADGTNPTATVGSFQAAGDTLQFMDPQGNYAAVVQKFKAIRDTTAAADATLEFEFFQ